MIDPLVPCRVDPSTNCIGTLQFNVIVSLEGIYFTQALGIHQVELIVSSKL